MLEFPEEQREARLGAGPGPRGRSWDGSPFLPTQQVSGQPGREAGAFISSFCCLSWTHSDFLCNRPHKSPWGSGLWSQTLQVQILPLPLAV